MKPPVSPRASERRVAPALADRLLDVRRIYHERGIERFPRAQQVLERFPDAERVEVLSHQAIPGLYGNAGNVADWVRNKREVLVLGEKKSLTARRNERSSDCSVDAMVSDNVRDLVDLFARTPNAKASFATKLVNRELLDYDPRGGTRVRFSLMPEETARVVDVRTSKVSERIAALDDFVEAGFEVHLNLSPVIVHEGWLDDWARLLDQVADGTNERTRAQLAAEIIFLTHNEDLHEVNLGWHPRGEELLWRPDLQQAKRSQSGQWNVRYKSPWKGRWVEQLTDLLADRLPGCRVRYAF